VSFEGGNLRAAITWISLEAVCRFYSFKEGSREPWREKESPSDERLVRGKTLHKVPFGSE